MKPLPWVLAVLFVLLLAAAAFHTRFALMPADCHESLPTAFLLDRWTGRIRVITQLDASARFTLEEPLLRTAP